jgi:hypothetical protein
MNDTYLHTFVHILFSLHFNLKSSKASQRGCKRKPQKPNDENTGSVVPGNHDKTENGDDESPAKRRKKKQLDSEGKSQYTIKKVHNICDGMFYSLNYIGIGKGWMTFCWLLLGEGITISMSM